MANKKKQMVQDETNTAQVNAVFYVKQKKRATKQKTKQPVSPIVGKAVKVAAKLKQGKVQKTFTTKQNNAGFSFSDKQLESGMLSRARKFVKQRYQSHRAIYQFLFLTFNVLVIFGVLLYQQNTLGVMSWESFVNIENKNFMYLFYAFLVFVVIMLLEGLRTHVLIYKATKQNRPLIGFKSAFISRYYDNLIPVLGGKPFELFYLSNRGIKPSVATSVPLAKYIFSLVATILTSTVVIITKWSFLQEGNQLVLVLGILMLLVNLFTISFMVLFSVSKKFAPKMVYQVLLFLKTLHIIKDHKTRFYTFMRFVLEYQKSVEYYLKSKPVAAISILSSLAISLLKAVTPFFIYAIFATPDWNVLLDMMFNYYILIITINFVPIPGGTGVAEFAFTALFQPYFAGGTLFWALLLWRFMSYYIYLLQGLFVLIIDYLTGKQNKHTYAANSTAKLK